MFNGEQKEEYLDDNEGRNICLRKTMNYIFRSTETMETELNKDVSEWTAAEIIRYYKSLSSSSYAGMTNRHSQLKAYAQWCLDHNMLKDNQNHFAELNVETLQSCLNAGNRSNGTLTRKQMENDIAQLLNPRDQCLIYALFEGVQGKEFSELTELNMSQVEGNTLHLATRDIEVHPKLIELMQEATEEYTYYSYGSKERTLRYDLSDDNVFKNTYNAIQDTQIRKRQRLYSNLVRVKDFIGNPAINAASLMESGRIDYISAFMKQDGTDLETTIQNHSKEITNKYGRVTSIPAYIRNYGEFYQGK